jgi:hypothetical protein
MRIAGLIIGILGMIVAGIAMIICLLLPSMNSHISFDEALIGVAVAAFIFFLAFVITVVFAIFVWKARKAARSNN